MQWNITKVVSQLSDVNLWLSIAQLHQLTYTRVHELMNQVSGILCHLSFMCLKISKYETLQAYTYTEHYISV